MFDLEGFRLDLAQSEFLDINRYQVKKASILELVKTYLIHYAYVETLQALEEESSPDIAEVNSVSAPLTVLDQELSRT